LKGFDPLLNLVLDSTTEYLRDTGEIVQAGKNRLSILIVGQIVDEPFKFSEDTRSLGLVVCRGTSVVLICPQDGMESIQNPFIAQDA
jgi:U6 snRNA-associated Sm-like protein LSm7